MWAWLSRVFRATGAAERAEADGRIEDAVRLYLDAGDRAEATRALLRAAQTADSLSLRRDRYARAFQLARLDVLRAEARRGLAEVTLAEFESAPPRSDEERRRLTEAARDLESLGAPREAARAWEFLDDREAVVRALTAAGDIERLEKVTEDRESHERLALRRRAAIEGFESSWQSGARLAALDTLRAWVLEHGEDREARRLLDERQAMVITSGRCTVVYGEQRVTVVGRFPVVLGREGEVVLRGASVSRRHCQVEPRGDGFTVKDLGSRAGTAIDGIAIGAELQLRSGQKLSLGIDLTLAIDAAPHRLSLRIDRGMDQGREISFCSAGYVTPLGRIDFNADNIVFTPTEPVLLDGQRVALQFVVARGDRIETHALSLLVDDDTA